VMTQYGLKEKWDVMTSVQKEEFVKRPRYKRVNKIISRLKKRLRRQQPDVDAALVEWGYASVPIMRQR